MAVSYALTRRVNYAVYRLLSKHRTLPGAKKAYLKAFKAKNDDALQVILLGNHGEFIRALRGCEMGLEA